MRCHPPNRASDLSEGFCRERNDNLCPAMKPSDFGGSSCLNNRIEQDHRRIKRRAGPMPGFMSMACAEVILTASNWSM